MAVADFQRDFAALFKDVKPDTTDLPTIRLKTAVQVVAEWLLAVYEFRVARDHNMVSGWTKAESKAVRRQAHVRAILSTPEQRAIAERFLREYSNLRQAGASTAPLKQF